MVIAADNALPSGIRYVCDDECDGYCVVERRGKRLYCDAEGNVCEDSELLERVAHLVIPPQWSEVWISADPNGHMQVTGRDARGRKQYIYHPDYVAFRQRAKFSKLVAFGERLPALRRHVDAELRRRTWDRERMLALAVKLLDRAHLRVGSRRYCEENATYGLTTLRRRHVKANGKKLQLCFQGKSGKSRKITIDDGRLRRLVREVSELPGYELFRYRDENDDLQHLDSADVNEYLQELMGDNFSAKDFRTWAGTTLAVQRYPQVLAEYEEHGRRGKLTTRLVKAVAKELGNTVSVCREYYIHPSILSLAEQEALPEETWPEASSSQGLSAAETYALELISSVD